MANRAVPQELKDRLQNELRDLFDSNIPFEEASEFKVRLIRSLISKLGRDLRLEADKAAVDLETYFVDYDAAMRAVRNIGANGAPMEEAVCEFRVSTNFLKATNAHKLAPRVFTEPNGTDRIDLIRSCVAVGLFQTAATAVEAANKEQRVITADRSVPISKRASAAMGKLGVKDADIAACIDVIGEMLLARKLLWLNRAPDILVTGDETGEPSLAMEFRLPISAASAAELNWELVERLVDADLFRPGVTFGFIGVR